ncbi:hypothetical protein Tco_1277943, partial [Tanacetum coccineum]
LLILVCVGGGKDKAASGSGGDGCDSISGFGELD